MTARAPTARPRRGATLLELAVVVAVGGVLLAAVGAALVRQHRFYRAAAALASERQQLWGALALLGDDLRGGSARAGDVTALAADSLQLRATVGAGVACAATPLTLDFPAPDPAGPARASWRSAPRGGDTVVVWHRGDSVAGWSTHAVAGFDAAGGGCAAGAAGARSARLTVDAAAALPPTVGAGAAVRVLRHVRYKLYAAADGRRYLGFTDYRAPGGWATVQPVSGPFATGAAVAFRYRDAAGAAVDLARAASLASVAVDLAARDARRAPADARATRDSLTVAVRDASP